MNDQKKLMELLEGVRSGSVEPEEALKTLRSAPLEDLGYACVDHHRAVRQGAPEVIYGEGKTPDQVLGIAGAMRSRGAKNIIVTRISPEAADLLSSKMPFAYHPIPRVGVCEAEPHPNPHGLIVVASAGTSDMAVSEEAAITAETLGNRVTRLCDVGVAGLHRLLSRLDILMEARVVIAVAGMEGALASVVGGLVDCPVIAVPTSVGYGASFGGVAALLSMLNSCASGVAVVNIDNGFGAGYTASIINRMEGVRAR